MNLPEASFIWSFYGTGEVGARSIRGRGRSTGDGMLCIGGGAINWEAVSALGTLSATLVALLASWLALRAPEWSRQAERRSGTDEVLRAVNEALDIYREAEDHVRRNAWNDEIVDLIKIRARHQHATLDRLIGRASLTDGAIAVGAGAMSILATILAIPTQRALFAENADPGTGLARRVDALTPARTSIASVASVLKVVEERVERVRAYAEANAKRAGWLQRLVVR